jgi:predicted DNA-binding ribbon-helix-helix protein
MNDAQIKGRLGWLYVTLAAQRNNLTKILLRLRGIGASAGSSVALHRKFMGFLEQVANDREKELKILNEIDEVERQHENLRERRLLRTADSDLRPTETLDLAADELPERKNIRTVFGLLVLISSLRIKHKKQGLTVD